MGISLPNQYHYGDFPVNVLDVTALVDNNNVTLIFHDNCIDSKDAEYMPPKRTSTSETPAITLDAIRQLIADLTTAVEAQTAAIARGRIEALGSDGNLRSCLFGWGGLGGYNKTGRGRRVEAFRRIRVGSWNVGSLTSKILELVNALKRHRVDIACFEETKWKGFSNKEVNGYKLWYSGYQTARNVVGVILRACLKEKVVHVNRCSDRIISLTLVIKGEAVNVISAGDLNGHIGATTEGYSSVHRGFGYEVRNEEGHSILDFATAHDLAIVNSYFQEERPSSNYIAPKLTICLCDEETLRRVKTAKRMGSAAPRILWKNLNSDAPEAFKSRVSEGVSTQIEAIYAIDADSIWNILTSIIKDAAKDSLVAEKLSRFKELLLCREGNHDERFRAQERYKSAKRETKKIIAQAKEKAYAVLYKKLDTKEGANDIFRIAKARQRRRRDLRDICFIKDKGGRTIMDEEEIKKRCGEYFSSLFNMREPEGREGVVDPNLLSHLDWNYSRISQTEVRTALQKIGRNKAVEPDQIPIEAWRSLGFEGISWLTNLFNKIFISAKMLEEWRLSDVIPICKNKGDAQVCNNYRGIKLLNHTMKLWERVIKRRLRREASVSENQFVFIPERYLIKAIHLIRSLMEKYRERQRDPHLVFIDLKKAYDIVPRELIWKTLINKGASRSYIKIIRDMYNGTMTQIQEDIPWCLIFVDDILFVSELAEGLNNRLENCRETLEDNGLRILQPKGSFRYLGSMMHKSKRIDEDIAHRIKAAWLKVAIRPFMLYGSECWPIKKDLATRMEVAELRMLRWTYGKTMLDMIPNGVY
ncbi:retrovirus-related pol polyprotein LINE-1 [Tanacetum coccineum]